LDISQLNTNISAGTQEFEIHSIDEWTIERHLKTNKDVIYTAIRVDRETDDDFSEEMCDTIFGCIVKTFSFTKKNVEYIPELDSFSVLMPGHDKTKLSIYLQEIIDRFNMS